MADNGTTIIVDWGGTAFTKQTGGSLDIAADQIDTTTKDSTAQAKEFISGEYGGTVTVEGLTLLSEANNVKLAFDAMVGRTSATVKWGKTGASEKFYTFSANVASWSLTNAKNEAAGYTLELQIDGEVTEGTNPP